MNYFENLDTANQQSFRPVDQSDVVSIYDRVIPTSIRSIVHTELSTVFGGIDKDTHELLCIKFPTREGEPSFARELVARRVLGTLSESESRSVVQDKGFVYESKYGGMPHRLGLVMPYMEGGNLLGILDNHPSTFIRSYARVTELAVGMASALNVIASRGLVHNDIKPANFLLGGVFSPGHEVHSLMLTDFGSVNVSAVMLANPEHQNPFSGMVEPDFTADYMSPENAEGKLTASYESDLYSMGVVLLEVLKGNNPFASENPLVSLNRHASGLDLSFLKGFKSQFGDSLENVQAINELIFSLLDIDPAKRGRFGEWEIKTPEDVIKYLLALDWSNSELSQSSIYLNAKKVVGGSELPISGTPRSWLRRLLDRFQ